MRFLYEVKKVKTYWDVIMYPSAHMSQIQMYPTAVHIETCRTDITLVRVF
jgi:hypothetical protein